MPRDLQAVRADPGLDKVSLTLESGHIYGLLGNNGAGKSTLLSILTDRQLPDHGGVTIDDQPIRNNDRALEKVFLVGEQNFFPDDMKVRRAFSGHGLLLSPLRPGLCLGPVPAVWPVPEKEDREPLHRVRLHLPAGAGTQRQHPLPVL